MEVWFIVLVSLSICAALYFLFNLLQYKTNKICKLPPGPPSLPILGNFLTIGNSIFDDVEPIVLGLISKLGPIITLHYFSLPAIFITNHVLAFKALVQNGAFFADRPPAPTLTVDTLTISSTMYGPVWRLLRRNLAAEILHPSRIKSYTHVRKRVLGMLINKFKTHAESGEAVRVIDHFQYAMCYLLVVMCFGKELNEKVTRDIIYVSRAEVVKFRRFIIFTMFPKLGKLIFPNRWKEILELRSIQKNVLAPLISSHQEKKKAKEENKSINGEEFVTSYVDTLLDLQLPDEGGKLTEDELLSLCSEFLVAGSDGTFVVLQWIMANLVKNLHVQEKLFSEIQKVAKYGEELSEEDVYNIPYLKAVVLEGLRRHPPDKLLLPHGVSDDFILDGYLIPKNALINITIKQLGRDPKVWEDPMEFKPERFIGSDGKVEFDITGNKEIKMMPFGAGRRICPGIGLALLHLQYFVGNLIKEFKWTARDGDDIDFTEDSSFTVTMKYPLQAHITPRIK